MAVVHVGLNTCWVNTVTESMWRALLKSAFPNAVVQLSSLIPPQGEHPLRKTVAASNAALVKACHSEQVMLADHTDTFTTNSGAPRKALCTQAPKAPCDLRAMSSMWANPDLPFDPKTALPIRHPLLVAECRCWRPLRFSHVLTARQASTSERAVGGASSTEMGQLF